MLKTTENGKYQINHEGRWIYVFIFIILIGSLALSGYWIDGIHYIKSPTDLLVFYTSSVAIMTLLYHSFSLEFTRKHHNETLALNKHQYTFDIISKIQSVEMNKALQVMRVIEDKKQEYFVDGKVDEFNKIMEDTERVKEKESVIMILNYFEHLSILMLHNHIDEKICKEYLNDLFIKTEQLMSPYLNYKRIKSHKSWCNFSKLTRKWMDE
jgi:hypothetical protein